MRFFPCPPAAPASKPKKHKPYNAPTLKKLALEEAKTILEVKSLLRAQMSKMESAKLRLRRGRR
jgi:hypothetical protein